MAYGMHKGRGYGMGRGGGFGRGRGHRAAMDAEMASVLGVSVEELRAARDTAKSNLIEKAVAEGELAPKQAERMQAARKLRRYVDPIKLMAQVLDMTPEAVKAALDEGRSPWDLAAEQNLHPRAAWQKLMTAGKATLDQAVADGIVTREQADELFKRRGRRFLGRRGFGPRFMGRGFGRRHGRGDWFDGPADVI